MSGWANGDAEMNRRIDAIEARLAVIEKHRAKLIDRLSGDWSAVVDADNARDEAAVIAVCEMRWPDFGASTGADRMAAVREQVRLGDEQTRRQYYAVRRAISRCVP